MIIYKIIDFFISIIIIIIIIITDPSTCESIIHNILCLLSGAFALYDIDKDGVITKKEMVSIVEAIFEMINTKKITDPNDTPKKRVDCIFSMMDKVSTSDLIFMSLNCAVKYQICNVQTYHQ